MTYVYLFCHIHGNNSVYMNIAHLFQYRYRNLFILILCLLLGIILIVLYLMNDTQRNKIPEVQKPKSRVTQPMPIPAFNTWVVSENVNLKSIKPNSTAKTYTFSSSSDTTAEQTAVSYLKLGIPQKQGDYHYYEHIDEKTGGVMLLINTKSLELTYYSMNLEELALSKPPTHPEKTVMDTVRSMGYTDDSITLTTAYVRASTPEITYYELHRSWEKIGYPILNPIGLMNVPETQKLTDLSLQKIDQSSPSSPIDTDIIAASDDTEGYARRDDFNTMTVAVSAKTGSVVSIQSNMRPASNTKTYAQKEHITTQEAITKLQKGEYNLFLTQPAGEGSIDWKRVYPENKATGEEAIIDEVIIAYLEKPEGATQETMEPYYLFRGHSQLESGYRVNWYAAVSAIKDIPAELLSFKQDRNQDVAGESTMLAQEDPGQKQDTLKFPTTEPTQSPTPQPRNNPPMCVSVEYGFPNNITPKVSTPTSTRNPTITPVYVPSTSELTCAGITNDSLVIEIEYQGMHFGKAKEPSPWYFVISASDDATILETLEHLLGNMDEFQQQLSAFIREKEGETNNIHRGVRPISGLEDHLESLILQVKAGSYENCPIRITGGSPTQFWYSNPGNTYQLTIDRQLVYSEPSLDQNTFLTIENGQLLSVDGNKRDYLYYEYEPIEFNKPDTGWVIKKSDLEKFSLKITKELKLKEIEQERLLFELNHASYDIDSPYLFIGIIPQDEIDQKLPLEVKPAIENIQRIHFYVAPLNRSVRIIEPNLNPVHRTETMILEIGAAQERN